MHKTAFQILIALAGGRFCSGNCLADELGISRTAVWKHIQSLAEYGIDVHSVPGKGYRLSEPVSLLDCISIAEGLAKHGKGEIVDFSLHSYPSITSTNDLVREMARNGAPSGTVVFAEHQSSGRGRRGREWFSPFAKNLYFSLLWRFSDCSQGLAGLSLAIGIAIADALCLLGFDEIELKWPNDIYYRGRKLAGILLEMSGDPTADGYVVIGVGLNVNMANSAKVPDVGQPWTDLFSIGGREVCRNQLVVGLLVAIDAILLEYRQSGLQNLQAIWNSRDAMYGKEVIVSGGDTHKLGIASGIDSSGALLLKQNETVCRIYSGEVSLRLAE